MSSQDSIVEDKQVEPEGKDLEKAKVTPTSENFPEGPIVTTGTSTEVGKKEDKDEDKHPEVDDKDEIEKPPESTEKPEEPEEPKKPEEKAVQETEKNQNDNSPMISTQSLPTPNVEDAKNRSTLEDRFRQADQSLIQAKTKINQDQISAETPDGNRDKEDNSFESALIKEMITKETATVPNEDEDDGKPADTQPDTIGQPNPKPGADVPNEDEDSGEPPEPTPNKPGQDAPTAAVVPNPDGMKPESSASSYKQKDEDCVDCPPDDKVNDDKIKVLEERIDKQDQLLTSLIDLAKNNTESLTKLTEAIVKENEVTKTKPKVTRKVGETPRPGMVPSDLKASQTLDHQIVSEQQQNVMLKKSDLDEIKKQKTLEDKFKMVDEKQTGRRRMFDL